MHFTGFFLGPFALGAFAATIAALIGVGFAITVAIFAVVTILTFLLLRPIANRHFTSPRSCGPGRRRSSVRPAMVLERIANDEGVGVVKIDGEVWTARCLRR